MLTVTLQAEPQDLADLLSRLSGSRPARTPLPLEPVFLAPTPAPALPAPESLVPDLVEASDAEYEAALDALTARHPGLVAFMVRKAREAAQHILDDAEFRVAQAYEVERRTRAGETVGTGGQVFAEDITVLRHQVTGYTVTANSPGAGSIAWSSLHIVYNGTDNAITDGNTNLKYAWFDPAVSSTVLQTSNTKPDLSTKPTAALIFVNNSGTPLDVINSSVTNVLADGAVDGGALQAGAVGSTALASNAVIAGKIASGAINNSNQIAAGMVDSNALGANAVISGKIATGAISSSTLFTSGVVNNAAIGTGAVAAGNVATGAITAAKLNILQHTIY